MRCPTTVNAVNTLFLTMAPSLAIREDATPQARPYTDIDTGITFYGHVLSTGYRVGIALPQEPATDFIMRLAAPLKDGAGWGGIALGTSMIGPLLLVTWPDDTKVMTSSRIAQNYTPAGITPYTANQITLLPIPQGTFINTTHISSTFLCAGCLNQSSFNPSPTADSRGGNRVETNNEKNDDGIPKIHLAYAHSLTLVPNSSSPNTALPGHTSPGPISSSSSYGVFSATLDDAKSDKYEEYKLLARSWGPSPEDPDYQPSPVGTGSESTTTTDRVETASTSTICEGSGGAQQGDQAWWEAEEEMLLPGEDVRHREMSSLGVVVLVVVGVVYLGQAFWIPG